MVLDRLARVRENSYLVQSKTPRQKLEDRLFTHREIAVMLNNCIAATMRPMALGLEIPEARKRKLRNLATEVIQELELMVEEDVLRAEEVVFMLVASAFAMHLKCAEWSEPLPYAKFCQELLGEKGKPPEVA